MTVSPPRTRPVPAREQGYATLAAVALIAILALASLGMVWGNRAAIDQASAELGQARASAAADAGLALALNGLLASDRASRWSIDGRIHQSEFDGTRLQISIEDERGKVPLNLLDDATAMRLAEQAGLSGEAARVASDSLLDWTDGDDEPHLDGAEADYYRGRGIQPRNGAMGSLDELLAVRGWTRAAIERIRAFVTVSANGGGFDSRFAQAQAIDVMFGDAGGPQAIERQREQAGQRTAIEIGDPVDLVKRPLTVSVTAERPDGARAVRRVVVELTGAGSRTYVIRDYR